MTSINDSFEEVLCDFKRKLTAKELQDFQFVTLSDVRHTVLRIQRDQENTRTMMNMPRIESFLEAMNQFGKIIEVFVNVSDFVAFVWGPLKFILQTASAWVDTFEVIADAYEQLGSHIPLLEQYKDLFESNLAMSRILPLIYADILSFHKGAIRFFTGKPNAWRQIFRATWKHYGKRFHSILDSLSRHQQLVQEQASLLHYQQSQSDSLKMLRHIQNYEQERVETLARLQESEEIEKLRKNQVLLEWFSAAKTTEEDQQSFYDIRRTCQGSGDWILKEEKVQNWMALEIPVSSILWINGIPGAGKTILASTIIDGCLQTSEFCTAYFYCKENDEEKNDCTSIYRGILAQFLKQCPELAPYCYEKHLTCGELVLTTHSLAEQLLTIFCEKIQKQYIIIDGLDECEPAQRRLVLSFFTKLVDNCDERDPAKLRILFVSQESPDIEKALRAATILKLSDENKKDIQAYVHRWCKEIQKKYSLYGEKLETVEWIEEYTCIRAQGMFLYAKLVMENLHAQETQKNLLYEIDVYRFPKGLEEAYDRIINRMKRSLLSTPWRIACGLLGWMVCAKRPLKWREIQAAVSMDPRSQTIDFEGSKLRSNIQEYCGSLVQVLPGHRVELVHPTAKLHITKTEWFHKSAVECNLAALCLQYLTFECFEEDISPERLRDLAFEGVLSFQDYAVAKWLDHVDAIVKTEPNDFSADPDSQKALAEIGVAFKEFVECYDEDMLHNEIVDAAQQDCNHFQSFQFYNDLLYVWNHVHHHYQKGPEKRNEVSIKSLSSALFRNRKLLESLPPPNASPSEGPDSLTTFYGEKRFKCPKITCFYFHEGFKNGKSRDQHINRHDRPFHCTSPDCNIAEFGFSSNKDMEKHMRFFHPDVEYQATAFAFEKKPAGATPWECDLCHKKFTRGFHMRSHKRSHTGEKPFACKECGRAFTRDNDCKRHAKIHSRR